MPTAKFELVCAVYPHKAGAEVELEVGDDGLPVAQVFKSRAKQLEVATPKAKAEAEDTSAKKAPPKRQPVKK